MTSDRARAYRRVVATLAELGPSKLHASEQDRIREAADDLIFATSIADGAAQAALLDAMALCRELVDSGRWQEARAMRLADDVAACGPAPLPDLLAA